MTLRTKGDYVDGRQLNDHMLWAFINDCKASGAGEVEGDRSQVRHYIDNLECHYVGWDRDDTIWTFSYPRQFTTDVTDQYKETPMRCIFKEGDKVVPNGFRAGQNNQHAHTTVPMMEQWERNSTVLIIQQLYETDGSVSAGTSSHFGQRARYHQSELRLATEKEIEAAQTPEQPPLTLGSVIKPDNGGSAMIVLEPTPDPDDDIVVAVMGGSDRTYYRLSRGYTVLGQVMPDGDYRPAAAPQATKPRSAWGVGDVVRLKTPAMYLTVDKDYVIEQISGDPDCIHVRDDDGDLTTRPRSNFEFVREGE